MPCCHCFSWLAAAGEPCWHKTLGQSWLRGEGILLAELLMSLESGSPLLRSWALPSAWRTPWAVGFQQERMHELFVYWSLSMRRQTQPLLFSGSDLFLWLPGDLCSLFPSVYKIKLPVLLHPSSTLSCSPFLFLSPDCALMHFTFCKSSSFSFYLIF